jgi:hypothetical protein
MISTSQKEHLTYTAIGQTLIMIALIFIVFQYIIPWLTKISKAQANANTNIINYTSTYQNGIPRTELTEILKNSTGKEELIKIIDNAGAETDIALKKTGSTDYLTWVTKAIDESADDKDRLKQAKQKLNSILPTLSPISNNFDEENITLKQYIRYIEKSLIKQFGIDEWITLGLQGIVYGDKTSGIPKNIGYFTVAVDFAWTNSSIQSFIDYINKSWDWEILNNTGRLSPDQIPDIMSNPLITVESFSLTEYLDESNPSWENSWRATLKFYIRGWSKEDLTFLNEAINKRKTDLIEKVKDAVKKCEDDKLCSQKNDLGSFQSKIEGIIESMDWKNTTGTKIDIPMTVLIQQVNTLRTLEEEYTTITKN